MKVSIIIPSRNEQYLNNTIDDIFTKAKGEFEVIAVLDGPTSYPLPLTRENLIIINKPEAEGLRAAINDGAKIATGHYLAKVDAHCLFDDGFDVKLAADCAEDWVVVPRLYRIERNGWYPILHHEVDYYYLSCPWSSEVLAMHSCPWLSKIRPVPDIPLDEIITFQGSMWFMHTNYWREKLHGIADKKVFGPYCEHQEISLKTWLGGGKVMVNKKTWYAHDHHSNSRRGYKRLVDQFVSSHSAVGHYFVENQWPERIHDFSWLIERFWPLALTNTIRRSKGEVHFWPEDWRKYCG